jgi:hypothetical protein
MTTKSDPEALLAAYLADGMSVLPDRVVDAVLDEVHRTRQRAVLGPWRTSRMNSALKLAIAAAAVIVVALAGFTLLPRNQSGVGGTSSPSSTPPGEPASPAASPLSKAFEMTVNGSEKAVPRNLTVQLPDGWSNAVWWASPANDDSSNLSFSLVSNTFSEPCEYILRSPQVDQTIESVATGFSEISGTTATAPVRATIAGMEAMYVEAEAPESLPCDPFWWWESTPGDGNNPSAGQTLRIWVVDAGGQVVAIMTRTHPGTSAETQEQLDAALETIVFDDAVQGSPGPS